MSAAHNVRLAVWIVGEPGVGKTSAVRWLWPPFAPRLVNSMAGNKWTLVSLRETLESGCERQRNIARAVGPDGLFLAAGSYSGSPFDGADRVPYNGVRRAIEELREGHMLPRKGNALLLFDGDRFSHERAVEQTLRALESARSDRPLTVAGLALHLTARPDVAAERRRLRGSNQNPSWVRGRVTKARQFAAQFPAFPCASRYTLEARSLDTSDMTSHDVSAWVSERICEALNRAAKKTESA